MSVINNIFDSNRVSADGLSSLPLPKASWTTGALDGPFPAGMTTTRASNATYFDGRGQLATAGSNVARIDFDPVTLLPRGLLVEESRTNFLLNSAVPVTQTINLSANTYTLWVEGSGSCTSAAGTAVGTGFGVATKGAARTFTVTTSGSVTFTVSGSLVRYQCENGPYPTSFITTTTAAATRTTDLCSVPLAGWFNNSAGTFVVEFMKNSLDTSRSFGALFISDGTASNLTSVYVDISGLVVYSVTTGGAVQALLGLGSLASMKVFKVAAAYALNDTRAACNGGFSGVDNVITPPALTVVHFGNRYDGQRPMNGWVRGFSYYPNRLPDEMLGLLSNIT